MATTTSSLKLTKPDYSDSADIAVLNTNADTIDTAVSKIIPVISGTTNNSGYTIASGDYFEANGNLYKATASIATNSAWSSSATQLSSAHGVVNEIDRAYDLGTVGTLASLESAIDTLGGSLVGGDQRKVKLSCSTAFGVFAQTYYVGTVSRTNTNRYQVILEQNGTNMVINGSKTSNGWEWDKLAFKNDIDTLSGNIANRPKWKYFGDIGGSNLDITATSGVTALVVVSAPNINRFYVGVVRFRTSPDLPIVIDLNKGSQITVTTSAGKMNIACSGTGSTQVYAVSINSDNLEMLS